MITSLAPKPLDQALDELRFTGCVILGNEALLSSGAPDPNGQLRHVEFDLFGRFGCSNFFFRTDGAGNYQQVIETSWPIYWQKVFDTNNGIAELSIFTEMPLLYEYEADKTDVTMRIISGLAMDRLRQSKANAAYSDALRLCISKARLVLIDFDDSIEPTGDPQRHYDIMGLMEVAQKIQLLSTVGKSVAIKTGRGYHDYMKVVDLFHAFGANLGTGSAESGAVVVYPNGQHRLLSGIPEEWTSIRERIRQVVDREIISKGLGREEPGKVCGISYNPTKEGLAVALKSVSIEKVAHELGIEKDKVQPIDVFRFLIHNTIEQNSPEIVANMSDEADQILDACLSRIVNSKTAVDISAVVKTTDGFAGITKETGAYAMAEEYDLEVIDSRIPAIIMIGDGANDAPVMRVSGGTMLPPNAHQSLRTDPKINVVYSASSDMVEGIVEMLDAIWQVAIM